MIDPFKMNPIKIADFKAILEKLEAEGHTEIEEIVLEWEYSCDELPDVDVKDGKVYMYFHDTWSEKKNAAIKEAERMMPASGYTAHRCPDTAHRCPDWDGLMIDCNDDEYQCCTCPQYNGKRKWDYLTYEEMRKIVDTHAIAVVPVMMELAEAIEAKIKEKNA